MSSEQSTDQAPDAVKVVEFDYLSDTLKDEPQEFWSALRECPVTYTESYGGLYLLGRFDKVHEAATNVRMFSSAQGTAIPAPVEEPTLLPIEADPPIHRAYRSILNPEFAPQVMGRYESNMRSIARSLVDSIVEKGTVDLVRELAGPLPRFVTIDMFGLPRSDEPKLTHWVEIQAGAIDDEEGDSIAQFAQYAADVVEERRRNPGDDLISVVVKGHVEGRPITDSEARMIVMLLIVGGLHTTTSAIAGMFHWLAQHPEDWSRLRSDEAVVSLAIDEFLRFTSPTTYIGRKTTSETSIDSVDIPGGSRIALCYAAANRDPAKFENPEEVVLDRYPNHHLAFGMGPHRCVGSHLAKLMMRVAIEEFGRRVVTFALADGGSVRWVGGMARGIVSLPITVNQTT